MELNFKPVSKRSQRKKSETVPIISIPQIQPDKANLTVLLKQFIQINTNISDLQCQKKELSIQSKQIEAQILSIMNDNNLQNIDTQSNVIQIKTTITKQTINQKSLTSYFNIPTETVKTFVDQLPTKTVQTLCIKFK